MRPSLPCRGQGRQGGQHSLALLSWPGHTPRLKGPCLWIPGQWTGVMSALLPPSPLPLQECVKINDNCLFQVFVKPLTFMTSAHLSPSVLSMNHFLSIFLLYKGEILLIRARQFWRELMWRPQN